MTAQASATHVLGRAVAVDALAMTEQDMKCVIVVTDHGQATPALRQMVAALGLELITVRSFHELPFKLHHHRPLGVVMELSPVGHACRSALRSVASYDPDMDVLLVSGDDPEVLGEIDVAETLWGLTAVHRLMREPEPADLIGFVFQASRRNGFGHLMPAF
jgi:hypothetical protein